MGILVNRLYHPEKDQADVVAESVEMCRGGVAVNERVLGRRVLVLQGAERLGVLEQESNVGDVGNREDGEASEAKPVSLRQSVRRGTRGRRVRRARRAIRG